MGSYINIIPADALAAFTARLSAGIMLTIIIIIITSLDYIAVRVHASVLLDT